MKQQQGFSLMAALFILVVLTTISSFTVSIAGMSRSTANFSMQGMRAYFAAYSGVEWGLHKIADDPTTCPANTVLVITQGGLQNFNVNVSCSVTSFIEGSTNINVFQLTSVASKEHFGNVDYVSREMQLSVAMPL